MSHIGFHTYQTLINHQTKAEEFFNDWFLVVFTTGRTMETSRQMVLCRVAAVKRLPLQHHSADYIFRFFEAIGFNSARFHVTVTTQINKSVVYFIVRRNVKFGCSE